MKAGSGSTHNTHMHLFLTLIIQDILELKGVHTTFDSNAVLANLSCQFWEGNLPWLLFGREFHMEKANQLDV